MSAISLWILTQNIKMKPFANSLCQMRLKGSSHKTGTCWFTVYCDIKFKRRALIITKLSVRDLCCFKVDLSSIKFFSDTCLLAQWWPSSNAIGVRRLACDLRIHFRFSIFQGDDLSYVPLGNLLLLVIEFWFSFLFVLMGEHDIAWHVPIGTSIKITFTPSAKINMMLEARGLDVG